MKITTSSSLRFLGLFLVLACATLRAQLLSYTFGPAASPTLAPATVADDLQASDFFGHLGSPGTGGSSPLSSGAYFAANTWTGGSPGDNYFAFTVTPAAGHQLSVTEFRFDYRATSSGPASLALRSSADNYQSALASLTTIRDEAWQKSLSFSLTLSELSTPTTFRLYGFDATHGNGTLRVDNVSLHGAVTANPGPVPEPASAATLAGLAVLGFAFVGTRRRSRRDSRPAPSQA